MRIKNTLFKKLYYIFKDQIDDVINKSLIERDKEHDVEIKRLKNEIDFNKGLKSEYETALYVLITRNNGEINIPKSCFRRYSGMHQPSFYKTTDQKTDEVVYSHNQIIYGVPSS